jgi:GMP synthase-like glutamine amidotransferase
MSKDKKAVCLRHVPFEGLGVFAGALAERGFTIEEHLVSESGMPREAGDLLVVMGGPMSVNDPDPWIRDEKELIRASVDRGTPMLGVCLGGQLLAAAFGGRVSPGSAIEIGMTEVRLTDAGKADPAFKGFPRVFEAFEWHGEGIEPPDGAVVLADSAAFPVQAFRVGARAYGLLFHLEMDEGGMVQLCRECPEDVEKAGLTADQVIAAGQAALPASHALAKRLVRYLSES